MALREIALYGQSILRMKAAPILEITDSIRILYEEMVETMQEEEGIGLAAPQVGESISLCVINLGLIEEDAAPKAYINPVRVEEKGMCTMEEGCLSIPDVREDGRGLFKHSRRPGRCRSAGRHKGQVHGPGRR